MTSHICVYEWSHDMTHMRATWHTCVRHDAYACVISHEISWDACHTRDTPATQVTPVRHITHMCVRHNSLGMTCLSRHEMRASHVWHETPDACVADMRASQGMSDTMHASRVCSVTWLIHMCDMTHSYVWHDSFMCDMTRNMLCNIAMRHIQHDAHISCLMSHMPRRGFSREGLTLEVET